MDYKDKISTQQIVKTILSGLNKGTFKVGEKLPSQRELSKMFGVGRMVIREAIKILEGKGVLYSKAGSGVYVKHDIANAEDTIIGTTEEYNLTDILSLSNGIWIYSMHLIIENASDRELSDLNQRVHDMYNNYSSKTTLQEKFIYESSFGMIICKITHNNLLYKIMVQMLRRTADMDYELVESNTNYIKLIRIDISLLESLISRDYHRAHFWASERILEIKKVSK